MKYIVEIAKEYEEYFKGILICGIAEGKFAVDVIAKEDLEELNSDYINEHFGDLQDTAYQRGFDDAWKAASNISIPESNGGYSFKKMKNIFGTDIPSEIYMRHTAAEAINKIKAYEEKQKADDEIEVGDEVVDSSGEKGLVVSGENKCSDTIWLLINGYSVPQSVCKEDYTKTGRHFDIASILEAMKHD